MAKRKHSRDSPPGFPATVTGLLAPPVLWAIYFVLIYSLHGIGCAGGLQGNVAGMSMLTINIIGATVIAIAGHIILGLWCYRAWQRVKRQNEIEPSEPRVRARFLAYVGWLNAALFLVATVWIGIPALMIEPCT